MHMNCFLPEKIVLKPRKAFTAYQGGVTFAFFHFAGITFCWPIAKLKMTDKGEAKASTPSSDSP